MGYGPYALFDKPNIFFFFRREGEEAVKVMCTIKVCSNYYSILNLTNFNARSNFDPNAFGWGKKLTEFSETSIVILLKLLDIWMEFKHKLLSIKDLETI